MYLSKEPVWRWQKETNRPRNRIEGKDKQKKRTNRIKTVRHRLRHRKGEKGEECESSEKGGQTITPRPEKTDSKGEQGT